MIDKKIRKMFVDSFISLIKQKDKGNFKKPLKGHYNRNHSTVEMSPLISLYFVSMDPGFLVIL